MSKDVLRVRCRFVLVVDGKLLFRLAKAVYLNDYREFCRKRPSLSKIKDALFKRHVRSMFFSTQ